MQKLTETTQRLQIKLMNTQQNSKAAPSSRQVFDLVNLYLVDTLTEIVTLLHSPQSPTLSPETNGQNAAETEVLARARIRLDGARIIFELLTRPNIEEVARKQVVGRVMKNILTSRPKNCRDDAPHQRQFEKNFWDGQRLVPTDDSQHSVGSGGHLKHFDRRTEVMQNGQIRGTTCNNWYR
jgi:hypothetical protein